MHPFVARLQQSWPPAEWRDIGLMVAVSGGADSVALLRALDELRSQTSARGSLMVGHFNHRVRAVSDADAQFVVELAESLKLPYFLGHAEEPLLAAGGEGWEATARAARYGFLQQAAKQHGARYLITAHTADDQAETILHRILRGTGIAGLAGIQRARPLDESLTLLRPILGQTRAEVVDYLAARNQGFCIDESNANLSYTRNRLRHSLLPQLAAQYNPHVREALLRLGQLAGDTQQVIEQSAAELLETAVTRHANHEIQINSESLAARPIHLVRELLVILWKKQQWPLQQMGLDEWSQLAALITGSVPATILNLPGNVRAEKKGAQVILRSLRES